MNFLTSGRAIAVRPPPFRSCPSCGHLKCSRTLVMSVQDKTISRVNQTYTKFSKMNPSSLIRHRDRKARSSFVLQPMKREGSDPSSIMIPTWKRFMILPLAHLETLSGSILLERSQAQKSGCHREKIHQELQRKCPQCAQAGHEYP